MPVDIDDPRIVFLKSEDAITASGICQVYRDMWCVVHPDRGVVFWQANQRRKGALLGASLQGNSNRSIAEHFVEKMYPWARAEQIPLILHQIDLNDYQH